MQPHTCHGVPYLDRRRRKAGKSSKNTEAEEALRGQLAVRLGPTIKSWRSRLQEATTNKDAYLIERLLTELNTNNEDYELHNHLRMDIVKAQLCLKAYYQWRQAAREQ